MDSQDGKGLLSILFAVLIVFAVMWLAVPWLQRSTLSGDETAAIATLRQIHLAQAESFGASRMYGSIGKLANPSLHAAGIGQDNFTSKGYEFYHSAAGSGRSWCAVAIPEIETHATSIGQPKRKSGKTFGIDEGGIVLHGVSPSACHAGTLDKSGGSPVR